MGGQIIICRPHNNCGMDSLMKITINDGINQPWKEEVADDGSKAVDVPNGIYKVYVDFGVRSNILGVTVNSNSVNLTATVVAKANKAVIERVDLT